MSELYTVDVLVNDKPIRKFSHEGKLFVESRKGQTYTIRIKNNASGRILAVSSVDGLDVLNGKKATSESSGYVVNGYNSLTIDGFRLSDEKVAKFEFDSKGESYAATKGDNSEKNVGVIGVRIFAEKVKPEPIIVREDHHHHHYPNYPKWPHNPWWDRPYWGTGNPNPYTFTCDSSITKCSDDTYSTSTSAADVNFMSSIQNANPMSGKITRSAQFSNNLRSVSNEAKGSLKAMNFDMGTKFGEAKESKVVETEFEKGILTLTSTIYYASRNALVGMGVPIGNEKQVAFPEAFADDKYAKPPKGWHG